MKIAITGKRRLGNSADSRQKVAGFIAALREGLPGAELVVKSEYAKALGELLPPDLQLVDTAEGCDLVVSIGGDGTFLKTARWVGALEVPIIGVNSGHLGYLSAVSMDNAAEAVPAIAAGNLVIESRSVLQVSIDGSDKAPDYALNEAAVLRHDTAAMITVNAHIDGRPLARYRADGLIVATPTGSTAYNLSVGGPLMAPDTHTWAISPVAAHQLTLRPLVVSDNSTIRLSVNSRADSYLLTLDGLSHTLPLDACLTLQRAPWTVKTAQLPGHDFAQALRDKLRFAE